RRYSSARQVIDIEDAESVFPSLFAIRMPATAVSSSPRHLRVSTMIAAVLLRASRNPFPVLNLAVTTQMSTILLRHGLDLLSPVRGVSTMPENPTRLGEISFLQSDFSSRKKSCLERFSYILTVIIPRQLNALTFFR